MTSDRKNLMKVPLKITESEESEETTAMPEDGRTDDDNRIESNDLTRRSQGQSKHVEEKFEKW